MSPTIGSPCSSMIVASLPSPETSRIVPAAASTSGSARTCASRSSETVARPVCDHSTSRRPRDDGVRLVVRAREDRRERAVDRVREDERAAHHRDAEHDRDRGQDRAQLAAEQAAQRNSGHREETSLMAARMSAWLERPSSFTTTAVREEEDAVGDRGRLRIVRDHYGCLAVARRPRRGPARGSPRSCASRGCRSARRQRARSGA